MRRETHFTRAAEANCSRRRTVDTYIAIDVNESSSRKSAMQTFLDGCVLINLFACMHMVNCIW